MYGRVARSLEAATSPTAMGRRSLRVAVVLAVAAVTGLAGCGGGDTEPLSLGQRLPTSAEVPGYTTEAADRTVFDDPKAYAESIEDVLVQATTTQATNVFGEAGFESAIAQQFSRNDVEDVDLYAVVIQFGSEEGARAASDWRDEDIRKPCPRKCIVAITEFDVDGIPGASGIRRTITRERLEATQEEGQPFDSYEVGFVDGSLAYDIASFGPPGSVTEAEVVDALRLLYQRVKGAPLRARDNNTTEGGNS